MGATKLLNKTIKVSDEVKAWLEAKKEHKRATINDVLDRMRCYQEGDKCTSCVFENATLAWVMESDTGYNKLICHYCSKDFTELEK
jgi:hypothetical protein